MPNSVRTIIITASLTLPLLLVACNRADHSPTTGSGTSQEKMSTSPSAPPINPPMEKTPPSPADMSKNPMSPPSGAPAAPEKAPADQSSEPKKSY